MTIRKKNTVVSHFDTSSSSSSSFSPHAFFIHPWWWYCKSLDPRCRRFVRRRLLPSHHGYKPGNRVSRGVPPIRNGHGREVVEVVFLRVHDTMKGKGGHQEHHSGGQRQQRLRPRHSRTAVNNTVAGNDVRPFDDCWSKNSLQLVHAPLSLCISLELRVTPFWSYSYLTFLYPVISTSLGSSTSATPILLTRVVWFLMADADNPLH